MADPQHSPDTAVIALAPQDVIASAEILARHDGVSAPRGRAYDAARRHSARVRLFKVAIPIGSTVAAALVVAVTVYNPFGKLAGLTLGPLTLSGTKVAMEGPRLTGFRSKDARPYEVTAIAAYQDIRKPNVIELRDMQARLTVDESGASTRLVSKLGVFDTTKEHLELSQDIRITTDKGDEVLMRSASVDFKAGTVLSKEPVRITTGQGVIEAEGVQVSENGRTISFTGRVRTQFDRSVTGAPAAAPANGTASGTASGTAKYTEAKPDL